MLLEKGGGKGEGEGQTGRNPEKGRGKGQKQHGRSEVKGSSPRPLRFFLKRLLKNVQVTVRVSLRRNPGKPGFGGGRGMGKGSELPCAADEGGDGSPGFEASG